jgi:murein DD-endopeptidase MepM/ murein hydrolase activator NlpD
MSKEKKTNLFLFAFYSIAIIIISYSLFDSGKISKSEGSTKVNSDKRLFPKLNEFGLPKDSLKSSVGIVKSGKTLSSILSQFNLSNDAISRINLLPSSRTVLASTEFDVKKILTGRLYHAYSSTDSTNRLEYFVYEQNPVDYVVLDFRDSLNVYSGKKEISVKEKSVAGIINNSLYVSLTNKDVDPELVEKLADIFAWQVDFYHIQKGDKFKVIYQEEYVENKPAGIGNILGAYFEYAGEEFYAIPFDEGNGTQYFDQSGKSLRKAFLKVPLKFTRISSRYSLRRFHPVLKKYEAHLGTDYAAPIGTPIHSVGDGIVIEAAYSRYNGNFVRIKHNSIYATQYLHMSKIAHGIHPGVEVKQGQVIGYVGSTGLATGPHLCFRFWKNGVQVDPLKVKIPPANPIKPEYAARFVSKKDSIISKLNEIHFYNNQFSFGIDSLSIHKIPTF